MLHPLAYTRACLFCIAADYFLEHGNPAKGVEMLLNAKQASRALAICEQQDLPMTEVCLRSLKTTSLLCYQASTWHKINVVRKQLFSVSLLTAQCIVHCSC